MIPLFASIRVRARGHGRPFRLWLPLPLFLLWILLAALGLLLSPVILVGCLILRLNPLFAVWRIAAVLGALAGTDIEVRSPEADVTVRVI